MGRRLLAVMGSLATTRLVGRDDGSVVRRMKAECSCFMEDFEMR